MQIISLTQAHLDEAAPLAAAFRVALKSYKGISAAPDLVSAREEMAEYLDAGFPVYGAIHGDELAGYAVCRVEAPCVWLESLYHCVHPTNHGMFQFL